MLYGWMFEAVRTPKSLNKPLSKIRIILQRTRSDNKSIKPTDVAEFVINFKTIPKIILISFGKT